MFRCNHHHQGAHYSILLKLQLLKQSIKILVFVFVFKTIQLCISW
jgi:hypothetical protein